MSAFEQAAGQVRPLWRMGVLLFSLGILGAALSFNGAPEGARLPAAALGAALLLASAGFFGAGLIALDRARAVTAPARRAWISETPQALIVFLCAAAAAAGIFAAWPLAAPAPANPVQLEIIGGALILLGFPLLVMERTYAGKPEAALPDAPRLARLLRPVLLACEAGAAAILLKAAGFEFADWIAKGAACFVLLAAAELALRAAATLFIPHAPLAERRATAGSLVAGFLRLGRPSLSDLNNAVQKQFGIDLSRSQALGFLRASMPAAFAALLIGSWAVTGLTATGLAERHIYERLGQPVAVMGPGLHVHLPWPFGIARRVELGTIHEIAIVSTGADNLVASQAREVTPAAEAPPPVSADRLWDGTHPQEVSYLLASEANGRQGFQIANVDLRVIYRVGLSDDAARKSAYAVADPESMLRSIAGRMLARYFARETLINMLSRSQAAFSEKFRADVQTELDGLNSGLEAIAVIVEAIHPPAGAANAYHEVQAAEIAARTRVSAERGEAARSIKAAERTALLNTNEAKAAASETVGKAAADSVVFNGDREGFRAAGAPFLMERLFDRLAAGLSKSEVMIVDHRLKGADAPTLDLRAFGAQAGELARMRAGGADNNGRGGMRPGDED